MLFSVVLNLLLMFTELPTGTITLTSHEIGVFVRILTEKQANK